MLPSKPAAGKAKDAPEPADEGGTRLSGPEKAGVIGGGLWLVVSALLLAIFGVGEIDGALGFLLIAQAVFLPVALIWIALIVARNLRLMHDEATDLHIALDAIRQDSVKESRTLASVRSEPAAWPPEPDKVAAAKQSAPKASPTQSSSRPLPSVLPQRSRAPAPKPKQSTASDDAQETLPLGTQAQDLRPPLERGDFIQALNFPETAEDKEGFGALRRALKDRTTAQLIQASQDVLTLLSEDGIYMDDLRPDVAQPEIWRSFAGGARGRAIAALGGIRDRSALALVGTRMKNDPIFRDAAHHFLRRFDQMFSSFAEDASDSDIVALSDTRTARAFMLLGRVTGTFD